MRTRPSSRLLLISPQGQVLLFRFVHDRGPLQGQDYWATPGGGLEASETFEQAAVRELEEETGLKRLDLGSQVFRREAVFQLPDGEYVSADERFFVIRVTDTALCRSGWSVLERQVMRDAKWWTLAELDDTRDTVWPADLAAMLRSLKEV